MSYLPEHEPAVLANVLAYAYTGILFPRVVGDIVHPLQRFLVSHSLPNLDNGTQSSLLFVAKVYLAADFFLLNQLKARCRQLMIDKLNDLRTEDLETFTEAAAFVYDRDLPEEIRKDFGCALHVAAWRMLRGMTSTGEACVRDLIAEYPDLTFNAMARCQPPFRCSHGYYLRRCPKGNDHLCGGICVNADQVQERCRWCVMHSGWE